MRPVVAQAPKIDPGKETQKLDSQVSKCKAGVAWIDILATINTLKFGTYNDRSENKAETVKLMGSFKGGIVPMKDSSAIPIIINLKRIKPGLTLAPDFTNPEEVPQLELSDGNEIIVASGQHRLAALKRYHGGLKDELTALTKKCAKIKELKHPSQDRIDSYNAMRLEMSEILGQLEGIGKWGVTVYNEGVCHIPIRRVVSVSVYNVVVGVSHDNVFHRRVKGHACSLRTPTQHVVTASYAYEYVY
jgi:hypothetical protein